jgi:hypothetical protein
MALILSSKDFNACEVTNAFACKRLFSASEYLLAVSFGVGSECYHLSIENVTTAVPFMD